MFVGSLQTRLNRLLIATSFAAYAVVGIFGHGLHAYLPCQDERCGERVATAEGPGCCCHHGHQDSESPKTSTSDTEYVASHAGKQGHDPNTCSLCTLLAKMKVGRAVFFFAGICVELSYYESTPSSTNVTAELALTGAPRGPPLLS
jgi:hypothetical protein